MTSTRTPDQGVIMTDPFLANLPAVAATWADDTLLRSIEVAAGDSAITAILEAELDRRTS